MPAKMVNICIILIHSKLDKSVANSEHFLLTATNTYKDSYMYSFSISNNLHVVESNF